MNRPSAFNMAAYVLTAGQATPQKTALAVVGGDETRLTYADLTQSVRGVAAGFINAGLPAGARILLRLDNTPLFPICYLGAIAAGFVPVPTSPQLTQPEVDKIADIITPALTLASAGLAVPQGDTAVMGHDDIARMQRLPPADFVMGDPDRPAYIVFTSGTSGTSRAVVHAHRAVLARRMMFDGWYGLRQTDRLLHAGAFNWTYTMGTGLIDPWTVGATSLIPSPDVDATDLPTHLYNAKASIFAAAPGVYRKMLKAEFPATPALRHGLSAGEKLPNSTADAWLAATGTHIYEAYGMSECSTFISGSPARPAPRGTLGFVQDGRQVKLLDDGCIAVHKDDPGLMLGYLDNPQATADKYDGPWFRTGDIGVRTADGAIAYEGRDDDMMNAGGLRVSPVEVEDALTSSSPTHEWACAEVRIKDDVSVIAAFYSGTNLLDQDALKATLQSCLAAYKIPRIFVSVSNLPRGANNKLLRRQLRTQWETTHGQT